MSGSVVIQDYPSVTTRECGIAVKSQRFEKDLSDSCFDWHNSYLDFDFTHSGRTANEGEMPFVVVIEHIRKYDLFYFIVLKTPFLRNFMIFIFIIYNFTIFLSFKQSLK